MDDEPRDAEPGIPDVESRPSPAAARIFRGWAQEGGELTATFDPPASTIEERISRDSRPLAFRQVIRDPEGRWLIRAWDPASGEGVAGALIEVDAMDAAGALARRGLPPPPGPGGVESFRDGLRCFVAAMIEMGIQRDPNPIATIRHAFEEEGRFTAIFTTGYAEEVFARMEGVDIGRLRDGAAAWYLSAVRLFKEVVRLSGYDLREPGGVALRWERPAEDYDRELIALRKLAAEGPTEDTFDHAMLVADGHGRGSPADKAEVPGSARGHSIELVGDRSACPVILGSEGSPTTIGEHPQPFLDGQRRKVVEILVNEYPERVALKQFRRKGIKGAATRIAELRDLEDSLWRLVISLPDPKDAKLFDRARRVGYGLEWPP